MTIIEVKDLTKKFKNFKAVDGVSFQVKKGEIFGFLGPNGAGKSTTIRILATLLRPTSGQVKVAGFDVVHQADEVRKYIGLVAEKIILYNHLTALENLEFFGQLHQLPLKVIRERAEKWFKRLDMWDWKDKEVGLFSTGMKQRVNIARALITDPQILFLDEPTLGLDPQTSYLIRGFIKELNQEGTTIILTTHDMIEAEALSDRVAIIDHGKIVALDTPYNLKKLVSCQDKVTLEDVFLTLTGFKVRDRLEGRLATSGPRHGLAKTSQRIR